jgi:hypothetical protein
MSPDFPPDDTKQWTVLRDAPSEQIDALPRPAVGRFVIALEPPTLDGLAESRGERKYLPGEEQLALLWPGRSGAELLCPCPDGLLLMHRAKEATWLPDEWEMDVFPAGWELPHLERWFKYALDMACLEYRSEIPKSSVFGPSCVPSPRGLVMHAYLIVRHLGLPNSPTEPRGEMDQAGCRAELDDLRNFFRRALQSLEPKPAETSSIRVTNRLGKPVPNCPGCGSPPAANGNVDDVCPRCGAWRFHCGLAEHCPMPQGTDPEPASSWQVMAIPRWEQIPPSEVRKKPVVAGTEPQPELSSECTDEGIDTRELPLEAPAGTPSPIREAYDAVAEALYHAWLVRHGEPLTGPAFRDEARQLSAAYRNGLEKYRQAEIWLQSVTDQTDRCAHSDALAAVSRINDACGHAMLGVVPNSEAVSHVRAAPGLSLAKLLTAMRQQSSRAALGFLSKTAGDEQDGREGAGQTEREDQTTPAMTTAQDFTQLRDFARDNLKGIQRRIVELVCNEQGECKLSDLAADSGIAWNAPWDNAWNSAMKAINEKLKRADIPWRLSRADNAARLRHIGQK